MERMIITVDITPKAMIGEMSRAEVTEFIEEIDAEIAEVDFTLRLIKRLVDTLECDMPRDEIADALGFQLKGQQP
jgi:hypothetical protein